MRLFAWDFLLPPTPLTREIKESALRTHAASPDALARFWGRQLAGLEVPPRDAEPPQMKRGCQIHAEIQPAAGKLKTVALAHRFRLYGMGGQRWLCQFADGFPVAGDISLRDVSQAADKFHTRLPRRDISRSSEARFRARASKSVTKNALPLWGGVDVQVEEGWIAPPAPLQADARPAVVLRALTSPFVLASDRPESCVCATILSMRWPISHEPSSRLSSSCLGDT